MEEHETTIAIFAKPPVPGEVKTRLIPTLGADGAAALALAFLYDTVALVRSLPWARVVIATTGKGMTAFRGKELKHIPLWDQGGGSLGARMERIIARGLGDGAEAVIALGADSPGLSALALEAAKASLVTNQAVLGPSSDGGYYLIGLRACPAGLLDDIPWSVPETFVKTQERLIAMGLSVGSIERFFDIDTQEDLEIFEAQLNAGEIRSPATEQALRALGRGKGSGSGNFGSGSV